MSDNTTNSGEHDAQQRTTGEVIDFADAIAAALEANRDPESHRELDPRVFHPSQLGYCKRQALLSKLGLKDDSDALGIFHTGTLIHEFMEHDVSNVVPARCQFEVPVECTVDGITFTGHADCYDPESGTVYDFKSRGGWYNFNPPTDRHVDQLTIYMNALEATGGQVVYISKKDLEVRTWPENGTFEYDGKRLAALVSKAKEIRDELYANGLPQSRAEIPFEKCGCYFCDQESLSFDGY